VAVHKSFHEVVLHAGAWRPASGRKAGKMNAGKIAVRVAPGKRATRLPRHLARRAARSEMPAMRALIACSFAPVP